MYVLPFIFRSVHGGESRKILPFCVVVVIVVAVVVVDFVFTLSVQIV
jgi:hypothetical protein